jgi:hypothetical protein
MPGKTCPRCGGCLARTTEEALGGPVHWCLACGKVHWCLAARCRDSSSTVWRERTEANGAAGTFEAFCSDRICGGMMPTASGQPWTGIPFAAGSMMPAASGGETRFPLCGVRTCSSR